MKRIIRLTESDLARIVRRVINEYSLPKDILRNLDNGGNKPANSGGGGGLPGKMARDIRNTVGTPNPIPPQNFGTPNPIPPQYYEIKAGDTLSDIAKGYNTTVGQLIKLNPGIDDPNKIFTGQTIKLK